MASNGAIGCSKRSSNKELRFYQVPSAKQNSTLRKQWIHNIRRGGKLPKDKSFYVCPVHFEEECYQRDLQVSFESLHYFINLKKIISFV